MKKRKTNRFQTVDWKTLEPGDNIKIIGSGGPYMEIDNKKYRTGVPSGVYCVQSIDEQGIHAYQGINHFFIYMGQTKKSSIGFHEAHKFKKIRQ
jgi:hypothetical protein